MGSGLETSPNMTGGRTYRDPYDWTQPWRVKANPSMLSPKYSTMSLRSNAYRSKRGAQKIAKVFNNRFSELVSFKCSHIDYFRSKVIGIFTYEIPNN